jgi:hypothetical protein
MSALPLMADAQQASVTLSSEGTIADETMTPARRA